MAKTQVSQLVLCLELLGMESFYHYSQYIKTKDSVTRKIVVDEFQIASCCLNIILLARIVKYKRKVNTTTRCSVNPHFVLIMYLCRTWLCATGMYWEQSALYVHILINLYHFTIK